MNEFSLIDTYFKPIETCRKDVIFGIGDDAACLQIPAAQQLLVSCDTLVAGVHFFTSWPAYDIAWKAVMVNVSDIAAMGGVPVWVTLALTMPELDRVWLEDFSTGLKNALKLYNIALIGGDTTRGPLSMTLTIHGLTPRGKAIRRNGAIPGDLIYLSGEIGGAALAVEHLTSQNIEGNDQKAIMNKLLHPIPRLDLTQDLRAFATSAIDISDGLGVDLNHICEASGVGAMLIEAQVPIHPLVEKYKGAAAFDFAASGGDDYELCFTISPDNEKLLLQNVFEKGIKIYRIGSIEKEKGIRLKERNGKIKAIDVKGYKHF
jgi:thiamine-monophosphate kinase